MKIVKLHIYGFGKHENVEIDLNNGINVFFGENEAGKTTIQQFILHIFFGFPQRNAQLLRYEPKSNASYGGKIQIIDDYGQTVIIERVKGKASGDVTVYYSDGSRGGEKELGSILHSYSRADFEAIFSFSLLQLQGFEKMTEEELTRTLLSSGTTGIDTLTIVENQFLKDMGELFKPSGRKPHINQKIEELRELETAYKHQLEEVEKYEPSIKRLNVLETIIEELNQQELEISKQLQRYLEWKQLKPLKEKETKLNHELEIVKHQLFPSDGIRRFELIKDKLTQNHIDMEQLKKELDSLTIPEANLTTQQLEELLSFLNREAEWHQLRSKRIQIEEEQSKTLQNQMQQLALVGVDWEKSLSHIVQADVSIQQEDKLVTILQTEKNLELELQQEKRLLQMKEQDLLQQQQRAAESKRVNKTFSNKTANRIMLCIIAAIFLIGVVIGVTQSNWLVALTAIIISVIVYVGFSLMMNSLKQPNDVQMYAELLKKEQESLQQAISTLKQKVEEIERKKLDVTQKVSVFLTSYHINKQLSPSLLPELFKRLRMIQEQQMQLDQMETKLYEVSLQLQDLYEQAQKKVNTKLVEDMLFHQLRESYLEEKKKSEDQEYKEKKITELQKRQQELSFQQQSFAEQIHTLYNEANVETESDYYMAYSIYEQKVELEKGLHHIHLQLAGKQINLDEFEDVFEDECKERLLDLQQKRNVYNDEKATLSYQTKKLLEDEEQSEQLQIIEQKKAELHELVKKWAAQKVVVESIKQMMRQLKEERLPEVLENAQYYFQLLTNKSYEQLILSPEESFEAVKTSGQRFKIAELSQATKEQAYISLRVALAVSLQSKAPFPIIMDDPFVHFDRVRLQQVVQLMAELQKEHQLLYFTCHDNMQFVWEDALVIQVATLLPRKVGIVK
ncbi:ATP-binding protein [Psychrobacillus psychrodurans]|uniref:AAA family ATPase n=1 Tax=Psychrobacillus psychrodurans TaxID=126157 RepID=A0A9X3R9Z1_9BACI|nr:AAA family ATPase [Psychrobacillus psychrodurans]MCZ8533491.1 AAA family ATPase [Psychrobacillus psychrodurans]